MRSSGSWDRRRRSVPSATVRLDDTIDVPVRLDDAWAFLQDTRAIAGCIPGLDPASVVQETETRFRASLRHVALGVPSTWDLSAEVNRDESAHAVTILLDGDEVRLSLRLAGNARLVLAPSGEDAAHLSYAGDISVSGRLAGAGGPIIEKVIGNIIQRFLVEVGSAGQAPPPGRWRRFTAWLRRLPWNRRAQSDPRAVRRG